MDKKPKCRGCGNRGDEEFYFWQPNKNKRSKEDPAGWLWHWKCYKETGELIHGSTAQR